MLRRSSRLQASGYYDTDGNPVVSYKEILKRVFKRRIFFRRRDSISYRNGAMQGYMSVPFQSRPKIFLYALLGLLCCGLPFLLRTLTGSYLDPIPSKLPFFISTPTNSSTDPNALESSIIEIHGSPTQCKHMWQQKELQDELLRLKKKIMTLFPEADSLPNFALETLGARVVHSWTSKSYQTPEPYLTILGIPIWRSPVSASVVIQGHSPLLPGRCWPFSGGQGHLVIALPYTITVSHVTLSHISNKISPSSTINAAPKVFSIYGMEYLGSDESRLGTFLYDQDGDPVQTFRISDNKSGAFNYIRLQIESNWGHPDYTCLYNFRVHGRWTNKNTKEGDSKLKSPNSYICGR
ncbi:hypothetical protein JOB18_009106 [Solea senegalensis]|uniref:SUN domain-containing protein n=1 Tax=Solea senegalensis TaxID=28829 RepID=A0AAV6QJ97_SOLSE|nr:SUN domain-containing protein 2-like [Solea senegalensis]KAG7493439.1 hypothetical protein JOB18_009106 [Solea senegalensis]